MSTRIVKIDADGKIQRKRHEVRPTEPLREDKLYVQQADREPYDLRSGKPYYDKEERLWYRVIQRCPPEDGWGTAPFWMRYYRMEYSDLCGLVRRGLVDGALEYGSPTKRFRVRNDERVREWLKEKRAHRARLRRRQRGY